MNDTRREIMARRARTRRRRLVVKIIEGTIQALGIVAVIVLVFGFGELLCRIAGCA